MTDQQAISARLTAMVHVKPDVQKEARVLEFYAKVELTDDESTEFCAIMLGDGVTLQGDPS
jgi:hypothetical protein